MAQNKSIFDQMSEMILSRQKYITDKLGELDGKKFLMDEWKREDGTGGGITACIEDGNVIERGACNVSIVHGKLSETGFKQMKQNHEGMEWTGEPIPYKVCGLSMIMHPHNPMAPTVHLNYRYFETTKPNGEPMSWWFGGGCDLTPNYLFEDDAVYFHQTIKAACDKHDKSYYNDYKKWCDEYFRNHHRDEGRGIGGIFFDDLCSKDPQELVNFATDCLDTFVPTYIPILKQRINMEYTAEQKEWQALRRGRYVEFNLIWDRGTQFGLHTPGARVESILCSMPRFAQWKYQFQPKPNTEESKLLEVLKTPVNWIEKSQSLYPLN